MIPQAPASSQINFAAPKVYDIENLRDEARTLGISPTRPNIRRIRRALDLLEKDSVRLLGKEGHARIYEAHSQNRQNHIHLVVAADKTRCTCEDARYNPNNCKHSLAVRIKERQAKEYQEAQAREAWITL